MCCVKVERLSLYKRRNISFKINSCLSTLVAVTNVFLQAFGQPYCTTVAKMYSEEQVYEALSAAPPPMKPVLKSVELILNYRYKVYRVKKVVTQWGAKIMLELEHRVYFVPDKYCMLFDTKASVNTKTQFLYMTMTGYEEKGKNIYPILKFECLYPDQTPMDE